MLYPNSTVNWGARYWNTLHLRFSKQLLSDISWKACKEITNIMLLILTNQSIDIKIIWYLCNPYLNFQKQTRQLKLKLFDVLFIKNWTKTSSKWVWNWKNNKSNNIFTWYKKLKMDGYFIFNIILKTSFFQSICKISIIYNETQYFR